MSSVLPEDYTSAACSFDGKCVYQYDALSGGAIAGICIGGGVALLLALGLGCFLGMKKGASQGDTGIAYDSLKETSN
jgi:hypothetical protein